MTDDTTHDLTVTVTFDVTPYDELEYCPRHGEELVAGEGDDGPVRCPTCGPVIVALARPDWETEVGGE